MEYIRRNITLDEDLDKRLKLEHNASYVIRQSLIAHYQYKDDVKKIAQLVEDFEGSFGLLEEQYLDLKKDIHKLMRHVGLVQ